MQNSFKTIKHIFHDGSFQPADLSSSSSYPTDFNRNSFAIIIKEVKRCVWWPTNKIPSVIPLAVIVCLLIYQVSHSGLYLYVKWKVWNTETAWLEICNERKRSKVDFMSSCEFIQLMTSRSHDLCIGSQMILSAIGHFRHNFRLHRHAIKQNNSKPFSK